MRESTNLKNFEYGHFTRSVSPNAGKYRPEMSQVKTSVKTGLIIEFYLWCTCNMVIVKEELTELI